MELQPTVVRVVPERSCLVGHREVVQERISGNNWTLCYSDRTVSPAGAVLEDPVPMLDEV